MSDKLFRISTPTIKYTIDDEFDMSRVASSRFIICNMGNKNRVVKENPRIEDMSFRVDLTQEETKKLNAGVISAQVHILLNNHKVIWTDIAKTTMNGVLGEDMFDVPDYSADTGEYEIDFHGTVSDYDVPLHGHLDVTLEGSVVIPNPEGEATDDLTKVEIDGEIFLVKDSTIHDWARAENKPTYTKAEVGLGNVDNTSDMNKPVSTATQEALQGLASATQTALNGKVDNSTLNNYYTKTETNTALGNKVDKVQGKGLSANDYDDTAKGIVDGVTTALSDKVDKVEGYGLSQNDYSDAEKAKVGEIDNKLDKTETAVNSNGLVIATPVTDTAPYIYRQTPVKESFKALMKKIVGASVVWNQLVQNGNFTSEEHWTASSKGSISVSNNELTMTLSDIPPNSYTPYVFNTVNIYSNRKYLISLDINIPHATTVRIESLGGGISVPITETNQYVHISTLFFRTSGDNQRLSIYPQYLNNVWSADETWKIKNVICIDLTAMFGTTIADYVYTLETSQSGSGIAWLQSYGFFTEDYYAYKQNKLESGCVSAKKIYGENLINSHIGGSVSQYSQITLRKGTYTISSNGTLINNRGWYLKFIRKDGTEITDKDEVGLSTYNYSTSSHWFYGGAQSQTVTIIIPSDNITVLFFKLDEDNTKMAMLNYGSTALPYTPYVEPTTYPISPITLRGLFKLSTDKLTVDGDEYNADGSVTRKYGIIDLGSLDWNYNDSEFAFGYFYASVSDRKAGANFNVLSEKYVSITQNRDYLLDMQISKRNSTSLDICVRNDNYSTKEAFKIAMQGVYLIYELATPTTEQAISFTETEIVGSTEEFIDYEVAQDNRDVAIPVGTETDYYQEMKLPSLPTTSGNHNLIYNIATGFGWVSDGRSLAMGNPLSMIRSTVEEPIEEPEVEEPIEETDER